ncbi:UDP-N-acetylmuramoyl-L-alanine--D-glutamate ligase [Acidaminobacterium chupaoyuni]
MTAFEQFLEKMKGKRVAVLGIGVSNRPLISLLVKAGAAVTACDKKNEEQLGEIASQLAEMGVSLRLGRGYLENLDQDYIFKSPGIRPDVPELEQARLKGSIVTSEMEVFFDVCPCTILAVTGSDGKTTTTTLINEILHRAGKKTWVGGNIGQPLLSMTGEMTPADFAVLELSSFQLMTLKKSPHVAVITNVTPNHLDMHKSMEEYVQAKENIFMAQRKNDLLILNADNKLTAGMTKKAKGALQTFSRKEQPENGAFFDGQTIFRCKGGRMTPVMEASEIRIPGTHNIENYMAAMCAVSEYADMKYVRQTAMEFEGVEHRIEFVRELNGVKYYNDAIATSPARAIAGLHSFDQKVIAIVGGYDKKIPFDEYGDEACRNVKLLILNGATAPKIRAAVEQSKYYENSSIQMIECATLQEAVNAAYQYAKKGDIVTLSPVCASFDAYPNFMTKGEAYKNMVNALK